MMSDRKRIVQLLARVDAAIEPVVAQVHISVTVLKNKVSVKGNPRQSDDYCNIRDEILNIRIPTHLSIVEWFETDLGPTLTLKNEPVRAQVTTDGNKITLYYDSRFAFNCYTDASTEFPERLLMDAKQLDQAQQLALTYFGPRRVPSEFRRRQGLLLKVQRRIKRVWLTYGWDRLRSHSSRSGEMNNRLFEMLKSNLERSRSRRLKRQTFLAWSAYFSLQQKRVQCLQKCHSRLQSKKMRKTFALWYRNTIADRVAALIDDLGSTNPMSSPVLRSQVVSVLRSDSDFASRLSPEVIVKVLMSANARMTPCVRGGRRELRSHSGSTGCRNKTRSLSASSSSCRVKRGIPPLTPPCSYSPYSPSISSCSPKPPLSGGRPCSRSSARKSCFPPRPSKLASRVLDSETPDEPSQNQMCTNSDLNNTNNDLSAWRKQALLQQKKLRSDGYGMNDTSCSSGMENSFDYRSSHFANSTPLSAQLVNNWSFLSSAITQNSSPLDQKKIKVLERELEQYVKQATYSTPSYTPAYTPATVTTVASTATSVTTGTQENDEAEVDYTDKDNKILHLQEFLESINLSQYICNFKSEDLVDLEMLAHMCVEDKVEFKKTLSEIGLNKIGHREKFILSLLEYSQKSKKKKKAKKKKKVTKKKIKAKKQKAKEKENDKENILFNVAFETTRRNEEKAAKLVAQHSQANIRRLANTLTREIITTKTIPMPGGAVHYCPDVKPQKIRFYPIGEKNNHIRSAYYRKLGLN